MRETAKRSLSKDLDLDLYYRLSKSINRYMRLPIDIFASTFYCGGTKLHRHKIILPLTTLVEGKLVNKRHKTSKANQNLW